MLLHQLQHIGLDGMGRDGACDVWCGVAWHGVSLCEVVCHESKRANSAVHVYDGTLNAAAMEEWCGGYTVTGRGGWTPDHTGGPGMQDGYLHLLDVKAK